MKTLDLRFLRYFETHFCKPHIVAPPPVHFFLSLFQLLVPAKMQEGAMVKDGKIVVLKESSDGRSCMYYDCCGAVTMRDELVWFKLTVADINGKIEEAIQAVQIQDGTASCIIGFLPQTIVQSGKKYMWESLLKSLSCMINWKVKSKEEKVIETEVLHHSDCWIIFLKENRGFNCK
jgi:hypothetical protein